MTGNNIVSSVQEARRLIGEACFLALVEDTNDGRIQIQRMGQANPDDQYYPAAAGLASSVSEGDLVLCVVPAGGGGMPVVVCEIVTSGGGPP